MRAVIEARRWNPGMFFKRSLSGSVLCTSVVGCAANRIPEAFFVPGTDTQIAADGPTLDMAAGLSAADWSYDPDLGGHRRNWAKLPTRRDQACTPLRIFVTTAFSTAALVILWFEVFWRYCL